MKFLEKKLEQIIFEADRGQLSERGLPIYGKLYRQMHIGNYGIADLISFYREYDRFNITVYELKKHIVDIQAFLQGIGYVRGIKSYLTSRGFNYDLTFNLTLIGAEIDISSPFCYLPEILPYNIDGTEFLSIYTYDYNFDGIAFTSHNNYDLTIKGF
jgi:hypothetical protein